jgi:3-hydroxypropionyl-CoA synthetase (ADP-forming)
MYQDYGFQSPRSELAHNAAEAARLAGDIGFPVALKIVSADILHKTDVGGVVLNLRDAAEVEEAYARILTACAAAHPQAQIEGVEVQEMVTDKTEVIIGLLDDPQFGMVVMFGLGGIFTEVLRDTSFRVAPIRRSDALQMVQEIRGYPLLKGYRGRQPVSEAMLADLLMNASRMAVDLEGRLESVDFNPIAVWGDEHRVLDAKILWHPQPHPVPPPTIPNIRYINSYFKARSVAVVGASASFGKIGNDVLDSLANYGYQGSVYPVNPGHKEIMGIEAYRSLEAIPGPVDLVVVCVGLPMVPDLISACAEKGTHAMVVVSGGGKELGAESGSLEAEIRAASRRHGVRVIGPNCLGVFDAWSGLDTLFLMHDRLPRPRPGRVALLTQSGTVGATFLEDAANMGVSKFVSYGNRADVDEGDLLAYLAEDPETDVIAIYLEGLEGGREFLSVAREVAKKKPIVVFKAGRSERAARASMSHTGFLGGSYDVVKGAFRQAGLIEVDSYDELRATCLIISMQPPAHGNHVGMISNGGGVLIQALDLFKPYGLELPELSPATLQRLSEAYPPFYQIHNPIDITGSATSADYEIGIETLMQDPRVDIVMAWFVFQAPLLADDIVQRLARLKRTYSKPMVLGTIGGPVSENRARAINELRIPIFNSVREWVAAARGAMRRAPAQESVLS